MTSLTPPIPLIVRLCETLEHAEVRYCHWKSNEAIDKSASGENDLDLLVRHSQAGRFAEVISDLGFSAMAAPAARRMPGVEDFFGYDDETGRLIHVQAHYRLVIGHDATKNFRLPIEEAYLASADIDGLFPLPTPEFEYVVFVLRMVLKHAPWDAQLGRQGGLSESEERERSYLRGRINEERVTSIVEEHLSFLDQALFASCVEAVMGQVPPLRRAATALRLQRALRALSRRRLLADQMLRIWRRFSLPFQSRVLHRPPRYRLTTGGGVIAIVGGDGSGKSTAVAALHRWLSSELDVRQVHLGKPPRSWTTRTVRASLRAARFLLPGHATDHVPAWEGSESLGLAGYTRLIWLWCTARDRFLAARRAARYAANGALVLADRHPHPTVRGMDAPQIARLLDGSTLGAARRRLIATEEAYHASIPEPDVLAVLRVDPEVAVRRKTDEDPESVRVRSSEIWHLDWQGTPARVIDAGRSPEDVLADLKALIWSELA